MSSYDFWALHLGHTVGSAMTPRSSSTVMVLLQAEHSKKASFMFLHVWNDGRGADDHALDGDELVDVCHRRDSQ